MGQTTRCCSAVALTLVTSIACGAHARAVQPFPAASRRPKPAERSPLSLFPVQALWTLALNNQIAVGAAPAFTGVRAFFPIEFDRIVAYDLARGEELWIAPAAATLPLTAGADLVFVVEPGHLVALRARDGAQVWQLPFSEPLAVPPAFDNGWLIAATTAGDVLAFRASDGSLLWRQQIGSPAHVRPSLAADRVYVPAEDGRVVALRVETGAKLWEHRLGGAPSEILATDERLFVGSKDNFFYCLKSEDGEQDWLWRTGADVIGLPVLDKRTVYFVSLDNVLWALNRNNGNQRWKRPLPLRPTSGPARAGQALLVSGFAPKLPAYKIEDGTAAGDVPVSGEIAAPPYVLTGDEVAAPMIVLTTRDIIKGATVTAFGRSIEPLIGPVEVLPNVVTVTPLAR
jgi:outer membrane protein assembly factor BamB